MKHVCKEQLQSDITKSDIFVYRNWYYVNIKIDKFNSFDEIKNAFTNALIELSKSVSTK